MCNCFLSAFHGYFSCNLHDNVFGNVLFEPDSNSFLQILRYFLRHLYMTGLNDDSVYRKIQHVEL